MSCSKSDQSNASARFVVVSALTFLAALTLRDVLCTVWDRMLEDKNSPDRASSKKFGKVVGLKFLFFIVVFIAAGLCAVYWSFNADCKVY